MVITVITIDGFLNNVSRFLQAEKERVNERKLLGPHFAITSRSSSYSAKRTLFLSHGKKSLGTTYRKKIQRR